MISSQYKCSFQWREFPWTYFTKPKHLSPQIIEHKKIPWHMMLENQVLAWDRHKNVAGLNRINDPNPTFFREILNKKSQHDSVKFQVLPFMWAPSFTQSFFSTGVLDDVTVTITSAFLTVSSAVKQAVPFISLASRSAFALLLLHVLT